MSGDPTHGMTMAPPRLLSGCGQGERCQHIQYDIGICRVCKLDLILATLSILALASIIACHLPLFQCIAIAFRMFMLLVFVSFVIPLYTMYSVSRSFLAIFNFD